MNGWIKLHNKLLDWEWYKDTNMVRVFIHLLLTANYQEKNWQGNIIKRGQTIIGREKLSKTLGISPRTLRTCLTRLKTTSEIAIKTTNKFSIITLINWEQYQSRDIKTTSKTTSKTTNERPANDQQTTTPKEDKNIRTKEEYNMADKSAEYFIKDKPINMEELTYEYENTPKKYSNKRKLYSRIAIYYMGLQGEQGNVLRYFKDIKELVEIAEKQYPEFKEEKIEAEIKGRINKWRDDQSKRDLSWGLSGVVTHWNRILKS